jgi:hypothetical protein
LLHSSRGRRVSRRLVEDFVNDEDLSDRLLHLFKAPTTITIITESVLL